MLKNGWENESDEDIVTETRKGVGITREKGRQHCVLIYTPRLFSQIIAIMLMSNTKMVIK